MARNNNRISFTDLDTAIVKVNVEANMSRIQRATGATLDEAEAPYLAAVAHLQQLARKKLIQDGRGEELGILSFCDEVLECPKA